MSITNRIFSHLFLGEFGEVDQLDYQSLIERLILFDRFTLSSNALQEIPHLIRAFGYDGTRALLKSDRFRIHCDLAAVTQIGQYGYRDVLLPLGSYCFSPLRLVDHRDYISKCFEEIEKAGCVGGRKMIKLKEDISRVLIPHSNSLGDQAVEKLNQDLRDDHPVIKDAVLLTVKKQRQIEISREQLLLKIEEIREKEFRVETNLGNLLDISEEEVHSCVERSLLGVAGLNRRMEDMDFHEAITVFRDDELPLFRRILDQLVFKLQPEAVNRFRRVLSFGDFPDLSAACAAGEVSLQKVLEIAESPECQDFRRWLSEVDSISDEELQSKFRSTKEKMLRLANGDTGKVIRWSASTGIGFIGTPAVGIVVGLLDSFLLDRFIPKPGPISFLSSHYRSIFSKNTQLQVR